MATFRELASEVARAQLLRARVALMNHELVRTDVAADVFSSMAGLMVSAVSVLQSRVCRRTRRLPH